MGDRGKPDIVRYAWVAHHLCRELMDGYTDRAEVVSIGDEIQLRAGLSMRQVGGQWIAAPWVYFEKLRKEGRAVPLDWADQPDRRWKTQGTHASSLRVRLVKPSVTVVVWVREPQSLAP